MREGITKIPVKIRGFWENMQRRRGRMVLGILLFLAELYFFFGTGALLEDEVHFLGGEGSWDIEFSEETPYICQKFVPEYGKLRNLSFRMDMTEAMESEGTVALSVRDGKDREVFARTLDYREITDCAFTDVEVDAGLRRGASYYLYISCAQSEGEGYPKISVCGKEYKMPENRSLSQFEELPGQQLVSRYRYSDALNKSRMFKALLLCFVTLFLVLVGLPENVYLRRVAGCLVFLAAPYILGRRLELLNYDPSFYLPMAMKWNVGIMYALEIVALLFFHSFRGSILVIDTALTALYTANFFVHQYRGTSLRMNDFTAIGTAAKVVGGYDLTPNSHLAFAWAIWLLFVVFSLQTGTSGIKKAKSEETAEARPLGRKLAKRLAGLAVTWVMGIAVLWYGGYQVFCTDLLNRVGFQGDDLPGIFYEYMYSYDGYLVATCIDIVHSRIVKPEGYSVKQVESILQGVEEQTSEIPGEELPHVILIMNESLADLRLLGNLEISQENLSFIKSMKENTIKGYVNASTFGAGTANSEFEVLTGCTMAFLPSNYYPYQQAINRPLPSMVSQMKQQGYTAIAMHPEAPGNWNRKNTYRYYGFDKMLWRQDFEGAEVIHSGVSDAATYGRMIELYENREANEKLFLFGITMQNHGGYTQEQAPYEVTAVNKNEAQLDEYLSLIKISDEAFGDLVHYFEKQDEKVIICIFGDHMPWIADLLVDDHLTDGNAASEQIMNKYRTPFAIWANYDIEEAEGCDISMNYLGGLLMREAGVPMSSFFRFLEEQRKQYPVVTINGYVDQEGRYSGWKSGGNEFSEYRMLQYNYLFDDNTVEWGY